MLIFDPSPVPYVRQRGVIIEILSVILFIISCRVNRATETRKEQIFAYLQKKDTEESKPEPTIREEPAARLEEIESALKSGEPTERAWALNELETLPANLADELRHKYE
ncbi:MAG: hypothetical protein EHM45_10800 [Desulfobacteraceae bacterium]|nr:MAG: hypothetical protein EHM45_10800 [Desulfobacteraceae bacterium]